MHKKLTILVTGVNGQVGFELLKTLQCLGNIIPSNRSTLDLYDLNQIRTVIREIKPSIIINSAAYTAVDKAETDLCNAYRLNADVPRVLAEEAVRINAVLIHYSTNYVFDGTKTSAYVETDITNPRNVYGLTKLEGERAIESSGCAYLILRTSWIYGRRGRNFLSTMLRLGSEIPELRIVSDQMGVPTWSRTVAIATSRIIAKQEISRKNSLDLWIKYSGIYHLTSSGSTSWFGFAKVIFEKKIKDRILNIVPISMNDYPTLAVRPKNSCLKIDKLTNTFDLYMPSWIDELRLCLDRSNP